MNFYTLFTKTQNVHLLKDVGMIPENMAMFDDVNSYVVTYKNGDYPYLGHEICNLRMIFLKKRFGKILDGVNFIRTNSKTIDVLNIYHLNFASFIYCIAAKAYLKKSSKIYLKLDAGYSEVTKVATKDIRGWIKRRTLELADVVSAETSEIVEKLQGVSGKKIYFITNGCYSRKKKETDYRIKENTIITVGRLGTWPKNTEMLLDAFVKSSEFHDWNLKLIGSYSNEFRESVEKLKRTHLELKNRIELLGEISEPSRLAEEYEKAKVFVLPSRFESFGIVLVEALMWGDYIVMSDKIPTYKDIIYNEQAGYVFDSYDSETLASAIVNATQKKIDWKIKCLNDYEFIEKNYNWTMIVRSLKGILENESRISDIK